MNNNNTIDTEWIVALRDVRRFYQVGDTRLDVLTGVNWEVRRGEWACLLGASGSGKTTLLHLIGALEKPDAGELRVAGVDLASMHRRPAAKFRNERLGFVFQAYHLLPELSIEENVMLPARIAGKPAAIARRRAAELLDRVGLSARLRHRPGELSGGEQQRAAIARALINEPELLLADEPTGNLDGKTGEGILKLFAELRAERPEQSIIMITHNREIAALADTVAELRDGTLSTINVQTAAATAASATLRASAE